MKNCGHINVYTVTKKVRDVTDNDFTVYEVQCEHNFFFSSHFFFRPHKLTFLFYNFFTVLKHHFLHNKNTFCVGFTIVTFFTLFR